MRRSYNGQFLKNGSGKLCGITLGADFCAEHEWGIKGIRRHFGISDDKTVCGIDRRRVQVVPESNSFALVKKEEHWTLVLYSPWRESLEEFDSRELQAYTYRGSKKDEIYTAWNENSFAVRVYSDAPNAKQNKKNLEKLYDAIVNKNAAVWLGGGGVFENGGLVIAIIDRCPQDKLQEMKESDEENLRLENEAGRINLELDLENRLKEAGKRWFALSPRFHYGNWSEKTVFDIIYWLNPCEQYENRSGWVTVEDLVAWIDGKGPIPEDGSKRRKGSPYAGSFGEDDHVQKGCYGKKVVERL